MGLHLVIHVCMSIVTRMYEYCAGWDGILLRHNQIIPNYYLKIDPAVVIPEAACNSVFNGEDKNSVDADGRWIFNYKHVHWHRNGL